MSVHNSTLYTPFQEHWWLDATAPGRWDEVAVERGGEVIARLPFVVEDKFGARILTQPALTQSLGPWVQATPAGYTKALGREMTLYRDLIDRLPRHDSFRQHFAPQVTNWLPFYWAGFNQTTRYSYVLDLNQSLDQLHAGMDRRDRRQLKDARQNVVANVEDDLDLFLGLNEKTFLRQGMALPYSRDYVAALDAAVVSNAERWIVVARDAANGTPLAAIYMLLYGRTLYSLMSGMDPEHRDRNAGVVARWEEIRVAQAHGTSLDLQGSMLRPIERRNRNYGATQVPYFAVSKTNGLLEKRARRDEFRRRALRPAWKAKQSLLGRRPD